MKKIFVIMVLSVLLIGSIFSENWKKVDTKVLSDEAWYEFVLDRPGFTYTKTTDCYIKEVLTVSPWIENQIVKEIFVDVDSIEFKDVVAREAGYSSYKEYQEELAYYNIMAFANIISDVGVLAGNSLR